jgi:hypothetical protein
MPILPRANRPGILGNPTNHEELPRRQRNRDKKTLHADEFIKEALLETPPEDAKLPARFLGKDDMPDLN